MPAAAHFITERDRVDAHSGAGSAPRTPAGRT
jgi:hypothetical protein